MYWLFTAQDLKTKFSWFKWTTTASVLITSMLGEFGITTLLATAVAGVGYLLLARSFRNASGLAALGPGILLMLWRTIGGAVGVILGVVALLRGEPGTAVIALLTALNLVFALSIIYKMLRKGLRR